MEVTKVNLKLEIAILAMCRYMFIKQRVAIELIQKTWTRRKGMWLSTQAGKMFYGKQHINLKACVWLRLGMVLDTSIFCLFLVTWCSGH